MFWTFWGAAREVTGSNHLLEIGGARMLTDCGLFQGRREESRAKNLKFPYDAQSLDAVVLGHAHTDHSGNLPGLARDGFRGNIHCTAATRDLCAAMLQDSAHLQESDAEHLRRRGDTSPASQPLYTVEDAQEILGAFIGYPYHRAVQPVPGVSATFYDAGHILGSALTRYELTENGTSRSVLYGCDLGRTGLPILRDPEMPPPVDVLVMESTYGDRLHEDVSAAEGMLGDAISRAVARRGKVVIPAFSLGRTQEIMYSLHRLQDSGRLPSVPVYVDSPLSNHVTDILRTHPECFDAEMNAHLRVHPDPLGTRKLHTVRTVEESKALNHMSGPMIIISASGMAEGGRVLHHLRNTVEDPNNMVLVVGFMAENTLGRRIVERRPEIRIYGEMVPLRAEVVQLDAYSAHGDQNDLLALARAARPARIYLVHGEPMAQRVLAEKLAAAGFSKVFTPARGERIQL